MRKIAIHSAPRSGSTWLGEIFNSSPAVKYCFQPLFSFEFKDFLSERSSKKDINNFFELISKSEDDFVCQREQRNSGSLPYFSKDSELTHTVYKEVRYHNIVENLIVNGGDLKVLFLVRDPIEVMNSWVNAPKEFDPSWDIARELLGANSKNSGKKENFYGLDAWISTTKKFEALAKQYPEKVLLVEYSQLKAESIITVKKMFDFCRLSFSDSTAKFLKTSATSEVEGTYSVFRGGKKTRVTLDSKVIEMITQNVGEAGLAHYMKSNSC